MKDGWSIVMMSPVWVCMKGRLYFRLESTIVFTYIIRMYSLVFLLFRIKGKVAWLDLAWHTWFFGYTRRLYIRRTTLDTNFLFLDGFD